MADPISIESVLIVYGPLGLMTLISMMVSVRLWKDGKEKDVAHKLALDAKEKTCADERKALQETIRGLEDRYIAKSETWMDKNALLAAEVNRVLDSALKLRSRHTGNP